MPGAASLKRLWNDRWLGLVFGMWIQACGGLSYVFSLYSGNLKHHMHYNQEQIDGLGTAKDIGGNVGLLSGLLMDVFPPWSLIVVGAILNSFGFTFLWLSVSKVIKPPFWQMCGLMMVGTNGSTWFNTAVLVTCMRNFPADRGVVVGLLVGVIGLSGAIFTQIYLALLAPNEESFLLLAAVLPSLVGIAVMFFIRPLEAQKPREDSDKAGFFFSYATGFGLAAYLLVVILVQDMFDITPRTTSFLTLIMFILLALPLAVPVRSSLRGFISSPSLDLLPSASSSPGPPAPLTSSPRKDPPSTSESPSKHPRSGPRLGQDFTLLQACCTQDFWLLFVAMGCGTGSGLTAINNLAQMAEALGSDDVDTYVSLLSVWNFVGRMGAGYISEWYVKHQGTPRPFFLMLVLVAMGLAHLLFASGAVSMLYLGSILVGLSHGAHWSIMVATASELFGLEHFGALYNTLSVSATVGSYICSVKIAGYFYDLRVEAAQAEASKLLKLGFIKQMPDPETCLGPDCFSLTFYIMAAVCLVGVLLCLHLVARTRPVYWELHKLSKDQSTAKLQKKDSNKEALVGSIEEGDVRGEQQDAWSLEAVNLSKKFPGATERRHAYKKETTVKRPLVR